MSQPQNQLLHAASIVKEAIGTRKPEIGLILGSGLGLIAEAAENPVVIPYGEIPGFHMSKVEGHAGQLVIGEVSDTSVLIMQGRFHYYEGVSMDQLTFPIKLMQEIGVKTLIITSASGGVNKTLKKGDILLLDDHINFVFRNPLRGNHGLSEKSHLPVIKNIYGNHLKKIAADVAESANINLKRGVYLMVEGPSYETKAEIRMVRTLGGDVVGMSTVPEALAAHECGISVLGITYVSNMASGMSPGPLIHEHVIETMNMIRDDMLSLITGIIGKI